MRSLSLGTDPSQNEWIRHSFIYFPYLSQRLIMKRIFSRLLIVSFAITSYAGPLMAAGLSLPDEAVTTPAKPDKKTIESAWNEFKNLNRKERRTRIKESKKYFREFQAQRRSGRSRASTNQVLLVIFSILLPPLAVYLKEGQANSKFWISILFTLLFWLPGIIYALLVVFDEL